MYLIDSRVKSMRLYIEIWDFCEQKEMKKSMKMRQMYLASS